MRTRHEGKHVQGQHGWQSLPQPFQDAVLGLLCRRIVTMVTVFDCRKARVGHMWIVEGHVAMHSASGADYVDGAFGKQPATAQRLRRRIRGQAVDVLEGDRTTVCRIAFIGSAR